MLKHILLPVDLTDKHQKAVTIAAGLAGQFAAEVTLLHVIELIPGIAQEEEKPFYQRLERIARKHLERFSAGLTERQIPCRGEVLFGNRTVEVIRHAQERGADLIILTAPQVTPSNPAAGWGSLSYKIGALAACPVLLVK
jgi:nucleotide-binding universal stress UspA family protein